MSSKSPRRIASRTAWRSSPAGVRMRLGLPLKQWVSRSPPQQGDDLVQIRRRVAHVHHQRQVAIGLLDLLGHAQGLQTAFTHHAAAHARLDADDEAGMAPDGRLGEDGIDVCRIRQLVLDAADRCGRC